MLVETLVHLSSRVASAIFSFLLFAFVARFCSPEDAKAIYFFAFSLGFLIVSLRTFGTISANLRGASRRVDKLRAALSTTGQLLFLQFAAVVLSFAVFATHPISLKLALAACLVVASSAFDADLLRASLNKRSAFSLTFAIGGGFALVVFLLAPLKTREVGCAALLVQWIPVVCVNLYFYFRLLRRRARLARVLGTVQAPRLLGFLLVAMFDGTVLNAPFLIGNRLTAHAGFDLSVAMRLFVSSLSLYPLLTHWSNSRALGLLSTRFGLTEPRLYAGILASSGAVASALFALVYVFASHKKLTLLQYGLSQVLLVSYCYYAARIRYRSREMSDAKSLLQLGGILACFYTTFIAAVTLGEPGAALIVALQSSTLLITTVLVAGIPRSIVRAARDGGGILASPQGIGKHERRAVRSNQDAP